ncbi:MAG: hypothetical protein QXW47_11785 [Candidatus Jordarchaeales archaeon]
MRSRFLSGVVDCASNMWGVDVLFSSVVVGGFGMFICEAGC